MTEPKKTMPKGGRKGAKRFPHLHLQDAVEYAKKLVSKTHTGPQPAEIILTGVFGSRGPTGEVRVSALKQYDLLTGSADAYAASDLAKRIVAAPQEEQKPLLAQAFKHAEVFN